MALTLSRTVVRDLDNAGIRARRVYQITGPTSYTTGGEAMTPGDFKLGVIECFGGGGGVFFWNGSAVRLGVWDRTNNKLVIYVPDTGSEVANTTDLSGYSALVEVIGK